MSGKVEIGNSNYNLHIIAGRERAEFSVLNSSMITLRFQVCLRGLF